MIHFPEASRFAVCFLAECIGFCFFMEKTTFGIMAGNSEPSKEAACTGVSPY